MSHVCIAVEVCRKKLIMDDSQITDNSGESGIGRLNGDPWTPDVDDISKLFLEIRLPYLFRLTVIVTQGGENSRVTRFTVEYLTDSEEPEWTFVTDGESEVPKVSLVYVINTNGYQLNLL